MHVKQRRGLCLDYNSLMKFLKQMVVGLLVLIPFGFTAVVPMSPLPLAIINASESAREAAISGGTKSESKELQVILTFAPWRGELWQRLGRLQLDNHDYVGAVFSFSKAKTIGRLSIEGTLWMADALISNGEPDQAKILLREVSNVNGVDPFIFLQTALLQRSINDSLGAVATLLRAYALAPLNSEVNYQLGLQLSVSEPDSAVMFLQNAARLDPSRKGVCDILEAMIEKSKEISSSAERYIYIGQVLSTFGEWDVAQRAFLTATEVNPENATAWALLAEAAQQNKRDGLQYLKLAQQLAPDAEIVNGLSALYYRRQGKSELALIYLEKALNANPNAAVWEVEIGNTLAEMGDLKAALEHFERAVKISPQDWSPVRALAHFSIIYNYEIYTIGLPAARQALALNPGSPALMDLLGTGLMIAGDLDSAERFFLQADKIDPNQTAILIHLGQLYLAKGEKESAFRYLRQAAEFAKDSRLREMANRILIENGGR